MGKWFPDHRTATPEQTAAYRDAVFSLHLNALYEQGAGIREETPLYMDLNDRVCELEKPLHPVQRWWHFQRVDAEQALIRLQRASDRQDREQRRARRPQ
jgi:hypothetical protein